MKVTGDCLCGRIACEAEIDPDRVAICHCADRHVNSGAAYGWVAPLVAGRFRLTAERPKELEKIAESGRRRALSFCADCGTRIHARTVDDRAALFGLRLGTCDQRAQFRPRAKIWGRSAAPRVADLSAIPARETQERPVRRGARDRASVGFGWTRVILPRADRARIAATRALRRPTKGTDDGPRRRHSAR